MSEPLEVKFFRHISPEPNSGCWLWASAYDKDGYGFVRHEGKNLRAHRVSYALHKGDPAGKQVCHRCDVPECVNPDHLFLGDNSDNQIDAARKGRKGSQKLTIDDVRHIRLIHSSDGLSFRSIAGIFGVGKTTVEQIISGGKWRHVD